MVLHVDAGIISTTIKSVSAYGPNAVAGGVSLGSGVIYYSVSGDSFSNWTKTSSLLSTTTIQSVATYGTNAVAAGSDGTLFFSTDSGSGFDTWTQRTIPQSISFTSITIYGTTTRVITGRARIIKTLIQTITGKAAIEGRYILPEIINRGDDYVPGSVINDAITADNVNSNVVYIPGFATNDAITPDGANFNVDYVP